MVGAGIHRVAATSDAVALGGDVLIAVDVVGVIACAAVHRVGARATGEHVVAAVAAQEVGLGIAGGVEVATAGERQVLDVGCLCRQVEARTDLDRVVALVGVLQHHVGGAVEHVGVVADAARHRIDAGAAIERVVAGFTEQGVGAVVAEQGVVASAAIYCVGAAAALEHVGCTAAPDLVVAGIADAGEDVDSVIAVDAEVFHVGIDDFVAGGIAVDPVHAFIGQLHHDVAGVFDVISVVAAAPQHAVVAPGTVQRVRTGAAKQCVVSVVSVEQVVRGVAGDDVGGGIAVSVGRRACQGEVLDAGGVVEEVVDTALDAVGAGDVGDRVGSAVDDEHIVAVGALERVGAGAAIDRVVAVVAGDDVVVLVAGGGQCRPVIDGKVQRQVFQAEAEGVVDRGDDRVHATVGVVEGFDNDIANVVHVVGVVLGATADRVCAGAAVKGVDAVAAVEYVGAITAAQRVVAAPAVERVGARPALQPVVVAAAVDAVVAGAAGLVDRQHPQGVVTGRGTVASGCGKEEPAAGGGVQQA